MIGHGRPPAWPPGHGLALWRAWGRALVALAGLTIPALAQDVPHSPTLRVRIQWGGPMAQAWQGEIVARGAQWSDVAPLAVEADEPGSMWIEADRLAIGARTPRAYDGVDVTISGPLDSELEVWLAPGVRPTTATLRTTLGELLAGSKSTALDEAGTQLTVRRAPGDSLRVELGRDSLVFSPGETWPIVVQPCLVDSSLGSRVRLELSLMPHGGEGVLWTAAEERQRPADGADFAPLATDVPIPAEEGVYQLRVETRGVGLRSRLTLRPPAESRLIEFVVVDGQAPEPPAAERPWRVIGEIDPATSPWWERMTALPRLPGLRPGPLGSGEARPQDHPLGPFVRLGPRSTEPQTSWEAYPLPVDELGAPHLLEVELPSDVEQSMGLSIVEPNAAGAIAPIGLDSGVYTAKELAGGTAHRATHELIFWPRSRTPFLVVTNRREGGAALYGKIRVSAGPARLSPRELPIDGRAGRWLVTQLDRPLWTKSYSAPESLDRPSGRSLDDWQTYYDGGRRLVDSLKHRGHNALMLGVLADGSSVYPSRLLEPTSRYDTGVFFDDARDPVRKDGLELLLRLMDREQMTLIPQLHLSTPLPALEALRRQDEGAGAGLMLIGADGQAWTKSHPPRRGQGAYYNLLDPRVQQGVLDVVREVVARAGNHPSFGGLAIDLSGEGYAVLPGVAWGLDDQTMGRFQRATGIVVPWQGAERFAARAEIVERQREAWLAWRAGELTAFYGRVAAELRATRPEARLYLLTARLFDGAESQQALRPALPRRAAVEDLLLGAGLDGQQLAAIDGLVLVRGHRLAPEDQLAARAVDLELSQAGALDRVCRATGLDAQQFLHEPQRLRLPGFDAKSPFRGSTTWLVSQLVPQGARNRQRFVHALARSDTQMLIDGGWLTPTGQDDALDPVAEVFRRLPVDGFETLNETPQPLVMRVRQEARRTLAYLINDSPWPLRVMLDVRAPAGCQATSLAPSRTLPAIESRGWQLELAPFDLVGIEFDRPQVSLGVQGIEVPEAVRTALDARIKELGDRAAAAGAISPWQALVNGDFETEPHDAREIPGWRATAGTAALERERPQTGTKSVRLTSQGAGAQLTSDALPTPQTGRLSMSVWLRVDDAGVQPSLRLALAAKLEGRDYYRYAPLGTGSQVARLGTEWAQYLFQIGDLPLTGLSDVRVRIELVGEGSVAIDRIELYDLWLNDNERLELSKIITTAHLRLEAGQYNDCLRLVEGFWPRLLEARVNLPSPGLTDRPAPMPPPPREARRDPPPEPGWRDRFYNMLPRPLRF